MALNVTLPHISSDCSNHEPLLQEDEILFYSAEVEGDIGPQENNPVLTLLQFEVSVLDGVSYVPLGEEHQFKIISGISVSNCLTPNCSVLRA